MVECQPAVQIRIMSSSPPPSRRYSYTKIEDLKRNQKKKANVFGVVLSFRPPAPSRGTHYSCSVELVDESERPVKCVMFSAKTSLPQNCSTGDVICIRRTDVSTFNDRPQLLASYFSSWLLFRKESSKITPITSSTSYTFTKVEKRRVQQLRKWAANTNLIPAGGSHSSLSPNLPAANTGPLTRSPLSMAIRRSENSPSTSSTSSSHFDPPSASGTNIRPPVVSDSTGPGQSAPIQVSDVPSQGPHAPSQGSSMIPAYTDSSSRPASSRHFQCRIVDIGKLIAGESKVGVCGIVKYFKPSTRSKGLDYYVTVALIDPSSPSSSLSCTLFNPSEQKLPKIHSAGDIVIIKGLKTSSYQGLVQARGHEHTLVAVFKGEVASPIPRGLGDWYGFSPLESSNVHKLREWVHEEGPLLLNTTLKETSSGHYFNTVCRVAAVAVFEPLHLVVLSIFDGTSTKFSCQSLNFSASKYTWETISDPCLVYTYQGLIYDVFLSDWDHLDVAPGDLVSMVNVYAKPLQNPSSNADLSLPQVELNISGQGLHEGAVSIVPDDSKTAIDWEAHLPVLFGPLPVWRNPEDTMVRCTFEIINEELTQTASIEEICKSPIGSKFVLQVEIVNIGPGPLEEVCQLRCTMCKTKYCLHICDQPEIDVNSRPLSAGDVCIYCSDSDDRGPPLQYMYVFVLHLRDSTGSLDVYVSGSDGEKFLPFIPPTDLYSNREASEKLLDVLYLMTGGNDPFYPSPKAPEFCYKRPQLKVCVSSYVSHKGETCYQLTDTVMKVIDN